MKYVWIYPWPVDKQLSNIQKIFQSVEVFLSRHFRGRVTSSSTCVSQILGFLWLRNMCRHTLDMRNLPPVFLLGRRNDLGYWKRDKLFYIILWMNTTSYYAMSACPSCICLMQPFHVPFVLRVPNALSFGLVYLMVKFILSWK